VATLFPDEGNGPYRVLRGFSRAVVDRLTRAAEEPEAVQRERLAAILRGARGTAFARDHGLTGKEGWEAFRRAVPVRRYDELEPWLSRVVAGERRVLTRQRVTSLLKTSGTTGPAKLLPVTRAYVREVAEGQALWRLALIRDHEEVTKGKALTVVSPAVEGRTPSGLPYGSNTGRMHDAQPWIVRIRYPVPGRVYAIPDPEARVYTLLRYALQARLSTITTANPTTVLLLCRRLAEHREDLAGDLVDGTLRRGPAAALDPVLRKRLHRSLRRRPAPADWRPAHLWPLATVNCWKGGAAGFFLDRLPDALGGEVPVREVGVTASEGYFAIPMSDDDVGGVAWLGGHVLEFVDEAGDPHWAWELENDATYRLIVTTSAGLVRYDLGDVVRVTGFVGRLPCLRFVRKAGSVLSVTGEKVTEDQVVRAMTAALAGRPLAGFSVGHRLAEVPVLRLAVEGAAPDELEALAARFDAALRRANVEYDAKRGSARLGPPEAEVLPDGTYARWRAARVGEGAPEAQVKDPVVAVDGAAWERLEAARGDRP